MAIFFGRYCSTIYPQIYWKLFIYEHTGNNICPLCSRHPYFIFGTNNCKLLICSISAWKVNQFPQFLITQLPKLKDKLRFTFRMFFSNSTKNIQHMGCGDKLISNLVFCFSMTLLFNETLTAIFEFYSWSRCK